MRFPADEFTRDADSVLWFTLGAAAALFIVAGWAVRSTLVFALGFVYVRCGVVAVLELTFGDAALAFKLDLWIEFCGFVTGLGVEA